MERGTTSEEWDGTASTGEAIARWCGEPGRVNMTWAGMNGWELRYRPAPGVDTVVLERGDRLAVVFDGLVPVQRCYGEQHVTPHRGCILR